MKHDQLAALMRCVGDHDGISIARAAKKLALSQSELLRLLAYLGDDPSLGGTGWLDVREGDPPRIHITEAGRSQLALLRP